MNFYSNNQAPAPAAPKQSFWQKLGAGPLTISLMIHAALLAIGVIWVIQVVVPEEKTVDFLPKSGGGGAPASEVKTQKQRSQIVQPKQWFVVYRGTVQAPKSGRYRFVGAGDDVLTVRFNNRLVFDYGYTMAATGGRPWVISEESYNRDRKSDAIRDFKRLSPMPVPSKTYQYEANRKINHDIGGLAVGPEFEVKEGVSYPIEILISEIPGGVFSTALLIQEEGVTYQKDAAGLPVLPLFRLDHSLPDVSPKAEAPPFDPNSPVWKLVPGRGKEEI
jgi:hypothetical protein